MAPQMKYTHVIWDFNGTILDDVALGIESTNTMLTKRGLPIIPDNAYYREVMCFPIIEYYRKLGFDFEREDYYTVLAPEWVALYMAGERHCGLMPHVVATLEAVRERGIPQIVLSASQKDQLIYQLQRLGIDTYFDEILGLDDIYAKSKTALAKAWREKNPHAVPLCVGDTDHDAHVADILNCDCLLYTGGHQDESRLKLCGRPLISSIDQLLNYLDEHKKD